LDKALTKEPKKSDNAFKNIFRKSGQFINKELKNSLISLRISNKIFKSQTDNEGYFSFSLDLPKELKHNKKAIIYLTNNPKVNKFTKSFLPTKRVELGIISDVDDTVLLSGVTHKTKMIKELFFKNYKQRVAIADMAKYYTKILSKTKNKTIFFISGSPNQLHNSIEKFLNYNGFPKHILITKKIHGKESYSLFKQQNYKLKQIEKLIKIYPNIKWLLYGDSGEKDREIYLKLAQKYSKNIKAIYIRDVNSGKFIRLLP